MRGYFNYFFPSAVQQRTVGELPRINAINNIHLSYRKSLRRHIKDYILCLGLIKTPFKS